MIFYRYFKLFSRHSSLNLCDYSCYVILLIINNRLLLKTMGTKRVLQIIFIFSLYHNFEQKIFISHFYRKQREERLKKKGKKRRKRKKNHL